MESLKLVWQKYKNGTLYEMWEEWKWIYSYGKKYKKAILFYIVLGMFGTVWGLVSSIASKNLIDIVTGHKTSSIGPMALLMVSMALFNLAFSSLCSRISLKINIKIQNDIQGDIFDKIINTNWLDLSKYTCGDILNRFGSDVGTVAGSAIGWFPNLITGLFSFLASLAVILYYDSTMAIIAMVNTPVMLISSKFLLGRMRKHTMKVKEMNSEMLSFQQETFSNMDSIKSFDLASLFSGKLRGFQSRYKNINLEYNKFSITTNVILSIIGMMIQYTAFGWGVYRLWTNNITYGEMTLFLGQASSLSSTFSSLVSIVPSTIGATISAKRIMEIINLPREQSDEKGIERLEATSKDGFTIELEDVEFSYIEGMDGKEVFTSSYLKANPNEIVALVGPSGQGKTTLIRMLLGLIFPKEGACNIVNELDEKVALGRSTRRYFSYVPQGNTLFSGTVAENLRMVKPEATEEELIEALQIACAYDFVEKMEQGMYTVLGERGRGLSEGQAQRISIARAVLRDAPILLLDEATSALDVETEKQVLQNIVNKRWNRTCIVTTHRPSVLSLCHKVYQVKDKRIAQLDKQQYQKLMMEF